MNSIDNQFGDVEKLERDVMKYHTFLLSIDIDVFNENISLEFLLAMYPFAKILGTPYYGKAVCYYLKHKTKHIDMLKSGD